MINKYLVSAIAGALFTVGAHAASLTTVVLPGTMTNLLVGFNQSTQVKSFVIAANSTNAAASIIDVATNKFTYVVPPYTNTVYYATNYINSWTNFYGVVQYTTNLNLIDVTNNVVAQSTNTYPVKLGLAALAGASSTYSGVNTYFNRGVWATNNSSGIATITIVY